jgi:hypothetical protein
VLSPGPGQPDDYPETQSLYRSLCGIKPIIGICLGFQPKFKPWMEASPTPDLSRLFEWAGIIHYKSRRTVFPCSHLRSILPLGIQSGKSLYPLRTSFVNSLDCNFTRNPF